jgi:hypothetical protein
MAQTVIQNKGPKGSNYDLIDSVSGSNTLLTATLTKTGVSNDSVKGGMLRWSVKESGFSGDGVITITAGSYTELVYVSKPGPGWYPLDHIVADSISAAFAANGAQTSVTIGGTI